MLMRWDPWADLSAWRRTMDWLMGPGFASADPALDWMRTRDGLVVRLALPDVRPGEVDVEVRGDRLTVRAQARRGRSIARHGWAIQEQRMGIWERTLRLPFRVDGRRAKAELAGRLLTVRLPRAEGFASRLRQRLRQALRPLRPPRKTVRVRVA